MIFILIGAILITLLIGLYVLSLLVRDCNNCCNCSITVIEEDDFNWPTA